MSNVLQEDHRPDGQSFYEQPKKRYHARQDPRASKTYWSTLAAIWRTRRFIGVCSSHSMVKETTSDEILVTTHGFQHLAAEEVELALLDCVLHCLLSKMTAPSERKSEKCQASAGNDFPISDFQH
ncbi:unnamed protein product [Angiostrongylus costaricensis]|uniref:Uncharacterized protein n=1 Tax=Angiostrongylus costaricensis TaxID=334426 RepID=A0A0R3PJX7_ANGCS|nr:unnamed protein product [Angiostrongylus costaricensis]